MSKQSRLKKMQKLQVPDAHLDPITPMNELTDTKLSRPMDRANMGGDIAAINSLLAMLNNPAITGAEVPKSETSRVEIQTPAEMVNGGTFPHNAGETVTPAPAPIRASNSLKLFFTGKLKVGKDHAAKATGATLFGFADPIYEIASTLTGLEISSSKGKDLPGVRSLLQAIGQWGRNEVNATYPLTPARCLFVRMIRAEFFQFEDFGTNKNIWLNHMIDRFALWSSENPTKRAAVTNARFENEFKSLQSAGWTHWHVMCSSSTWEKRLLASKLTPASPTVKDMSEQLAVALDNNVIKQISAKKDGLKLRCIWNDEFVAPPSNRFHTLNSFLQTLAIEEVGREMDDESGILTGE